MKLRIERNEKVTPTVVQRLFLSLYHLLRVWSAYVPVFKMKIQVAQRTPKMAPRSWMMLIQRT